MLLAVLYVQEVLALRPGRAAWLFPALNLTVIAASLAGPALIGRLGPRRVGDRRPGADRPRQPAADHRAADGAAAYSGCCPPSR